MNAIAEARAVLRVEIRALELTQKGLDEKFTQAMELLRTRKGKIVVSGIGKSGLIGQKMAATFSSTGSPAVFLHAADAIHGDLGVVDPHDVVIMLSHSGETEETLTIIPALRRIGAKVIALVGNGRARLAQMADAMVVVAVPKEADHLNLAPTSSALTALAIGDAMAALLSKWRGFRPEDFALYHPGGQLGRRLLLCVADLMHKVDEVPLVTPQAKFDEIVAGLTKNVPGAGALGAVLVVKSGRDHTLAGIITDGDMRRSMARFREKIFQMTAGELMTSNPISITQEAKAEEALELMENRPSQIRELPVLDKEGRVAGLLRLHDLLQIGFHSQAHDAAKR